jgi:Na+-driven multidrug efflux pump
MSVGVGLSTALTTLAGQSHGALNLRKIEGMTIIYGSKINDQENQRLLKESDYHGKKSLSTTVYLFRGMFITFLFVIPIGLYWLNGIKPLLIWLGQGEAVSDMTQVSF